MLNDAPAVTKLANGGVCIIFVMPGCGLPFIAHWGSDVSDAVAWEIVRTAEPATMNSSFDRPRVFTIAPTQSDGWSGTPGIEWHTGGVPAAGFTVQSIESDTASARFVLVDARLSMEVTLEYEIDQAGVLAVRASALNTGGGVVDLVGIRHFVPVPPRAHELLDQTGQWSGERRPQRRSIVDGTTVRASRRGRPGHDSAFVSLVGTEGFGFRSGEVWATHVAWSGNQEYITERLPEGAGALSSIVGGGELLLPGEIRLSTGQTYQGPDVLFAWSDRGIDGVSDRFHKRVRGLSSYPAGPRPLVLNTWEAVYFDHDFDRLEILATQAAAIGVERFVLDDGWFLGRRNDTAGLGDWRVDPVVWPGGLGRLADLAHSLGMQFGLWFEPEMINLDSELARAHPDWILGGPVGEESSWRHQFVLDLSNPHAYAFVLESIDGIVADAGVDFIKWDHNRDLHDAEGAASDARVHLQTLAVYSMMDQLRADHPKLEIESCASGGARVDLGVIAHTQRVWASDTNDPIERQMVQRWTGVLLPPELVGTHIGPLESHTTHRVSSLQFRLLTALFGHAGIEWDITSLSDGERAAIASWAATYREFRELLATGTTVRADDVDPGAMLHGVISPDLATALFAWIRIDTSTTAHSDRVRIPGLALDRRYAIRVRDDFGTASRHQVADPGWMTAENRADDIVLSGALLAEVGVPLPVLNPGSGMLLQLTAVR